MTRRSFFRVFGLAAILAPVAKVCAAEGGFGVVPMGSHTCAGDPLELTQEIPDKCAVDFEIPAAWYPIEWEETTYNTKTGAVVSVRTSVQYSP